MLAAIEADPTLEIVVDIERRTIEAPALAMSAEFPLDDSTRERFLQGLDDIGITLRHEAAIDTFEGARPTWMPTVS